MQTGVLFPGFIWFCNNCTLNLIPRRNPFKKTELLKFPQLLLFAGWKGGNIF
jgi:hypothetical protein